MTVSKMISRSYRRGYRFVKRRRLRKKRKDQTMRRRANTT